MNHTAIVANLSQYIEDMDVIRANNPSIPFLLGETNSDYVNLGMNQDEGVFGSSLWLVDFLLYGMSLVRSLCPNPPYSLTLFERTLHVSI